MAESSDGTPADTLEGAEAIFLALEDSGPLAPAEIADRARLPLADVRDMVEQMAQLRLLTRQDSRYDLGSRLADLGVHALRGHWFQRAALPALQDLQYRTGLVVHLGFLDGGDTIFWERLASDGGPHVPTRVGGRVEAYRTAVGKAMLSQLPVTTLDDAQVGRPGRRAGAVIDDQLRTELDEVITDGVAFDRAETVAGLGCVAAPIPYRLRAPAAVSVCGPAIRVLNDRRLVSAVKQTASEIAAIAERNHPAPPASSN